MMYRLWYAPDFNEVFCRFVASRYREIGSRHSEGGRLRENQRPAHADNRRFVLKA